MALKFIYCAVERMKSNNTLLHSFWNNSSDIITRKHIETNGIHIDQLTPYLYTAGPCYYYIVDFFDRQIKHISSDIQHILGLSPTTVTFDHIIGRIHPEDMMYVARAEAAVLNHLYQHIGRDKVKQYKMSYCFRFKTADDTYQLFQHQSIILSTDESGGFATALNIHTNISHITTANSNIATITNLSDESDFIRLDLNEVLALPASISLYTKRELEIIRLISRGVKNTEIADTLVISIHTVKNHRKNILKKACVKSSSELIAKCFAESLI